MADTTYAHLPYLLISTLTGLQSMLDFPLEQLVYALLMLLSVMFGLCFRYLIKSHVSRQYLSLILGAVFLYILYGPR